MSNNFPCNQVPVKFVNCCQVMDCINIESSDNSVGVEKSGCGIDLKITANNLDNILQINNGECITFTKEFINGKLHITPNINMACIANIICNLCAGDQIIGRLFVLGDNCSQDTQINSVLFNNLPPQFVSGNLPVAIGQPDVFKSFPPGTHTIKVVISGNPGFIRFQDSLGTVTCLPFIPGTTEYSVNNFVINSSADWKINLSCGTCT